jgi:hypothetical protein
LRYRKIDSPLSLATGSRKATYSSILKLIPISSKSDLVRRNLGIDVFRNLTTSKSCFFQSMIYCTCKPFLEYNTYTVYWGTVAVCSIQHAVRHCLVSCMQCTSTNKLLPIHIIQAYSDWHIYIPINIVYGCVHILNHTLSEPCEHYHVVSVGICTLHIHP